MQSTPGSPSQRIPTLDGWRGVAILMVLVAHAFSSEGQTGGVGYRLGGHGVAIFFVLSGFLITTRLLAGELGHLRRFYLRRALRLWPVAWTFLLLWFLFGAAVRSNIIGGPDAAACLLFYRNYVAGNTTVTGHFWSLAIEEQFYIVWPALLMLLPRRLALPSVLAMAAGCAAYRWMHWPQTFTATIRTEMQLSALLVGCALALALQLPAVARFFARYNSAIVLTAAALLAVAVVRYGLVIPAWECVAVAALLGATSMRPDAALSRMLDSAPLRGVGVVSYSLYVWQQPFLLPRWGGAFAVRIVVLAGFTLASYCFIEQPMRRWGARLADAVERENTARDEVARAAVSLDGDASYG